MTYRTFIKSWGTLLLVPLLLTVSLISVSLGADYWLRAEVKVIPAGTFNNHSSITMWGYARCDAGFANCTTATVPGPTLTAAAGETLNINVFNNISGSYKEPTSVVIPGQIKGAAQPMTPVWIDPADPLGPPVASGTRGTNYQARVRSFDAETAFGQTHTYTWTNLRAGTYLYESGTHPGVQVQMGLYGPLIVGGAASDVTLLFSEIDPVLHAAVSNGDYGPGKTVTSPTGYRPQYFLVNGSPYSTSSPAANAGSPGTVRLRMLNAGLEPKIPTLQDKYNLLADKHMTVIAEDGNESPNFHPKLQYSQLLPPGKTMDALITTQAVGNVVVYDRKLNLTNNGSFLPGGALINLNIGAVPAINVIPNVLSFGDVPLFRPVQIVVAIKNDGLANLVVAGTSGITGPDSAQFRTVFSITTIPPGTSSTVSVLFRPTTAGPKTAALTLNTDDPNLGTVTIPIFANGF